MSFAPFRLRAAPLLIVAAAAWGSPLPSLAAASASASFTNISLTVVDLDLNDGITAGFIFVPGNSTFEGAFGAANTVPTNDSQFIFETGLDSPFIARSASASVIGAQVSGTTTSNSIVISGSASATGAEFSGFFHLQTSRGDLFGMQLAPHTRVIVNADYSASASVFDACAALCEQAIASVFIDASGDIGGGSVGTTVSAHAQPGGGILTSGGPESGSFQLLISNPGDFAADAQLRFHVNVSGVAAIPEPETYALMLLGLGSLGMVLRRRRSGWNRFGLRR
jgi:hypothetical protein